MDTARPRTPTAALFVAIALALPAGAPLAGGSGHTKEAGDPAAPPAIADIYDWRNHQPTQAEVQARERASGIEPSAQRQSREAAEVDQIYEQLMWKPPTGTAEHRDAPAH